MSHSRNLSADFPSQDKAVTESKVCEQGSEGLIAPKIPEILPFARVRGRGRRRRNSI